MGPRRIEALVEEINGRSPDLVALVGDYVDTSVIGGGRADPAGVARRLARLRAPAVAVMGNHDWRHEGASMARVLRNAGVPVLENETTTLTLRGGPLHVGGVGDLRQRDPRVGSALGDAEPPILLLTHDPDVFPYVPARVSLTLAGHLHGGQIDLPLMRRFMPSRHGRRFQEGHIVEGGRHLFVSRGIGHAGLPVRVRARAEVPILRLQREENAS